MSLDKGNRASLALCHAKAVLELLTEVGVGEHADAIETVIHFIDEAKAIVDETDRRKPEVPS